MRLKIFQKIVLAMIVSTALIASLIALLLKLSFMFGLAIFVGCLLACVVAFACFFYFQQHLVETTDALAEGTRKVAAGEFSSRVYLKSTDQLGALAKDFNTMAETLDRHDRAHKQWFTDTSHELRTPLAVLRAQVEALQDGVQRADEKTLAVLHDQIMALTRLVDDLHDLAKHDVGKLSCALVPLDLVPVLQSAVVSFDERFKNKQITVHFEEPPESWNISGDYVRLKQLFANILENSYRYTDNSGSVRIAGCVKDGSLLLNIDDSAPGVPPDGLLRIFDRFYRAEESRSRASGGTGLGLPICQTIVRAHGGDINAMQSPLGGLRIAIKLPLIEGRA